MHGTIADTGLVADLEHDIGLAETELASTRNEIEALYELATALTADVMRGHAWVVRMSEAHLRLKAGRL